MTEPDGSPDAPTRKPAGWQRWLIIGIAAVIFVVILANLGGDDDEDPTASGDDPEPTATSEPTEEPADDFDADQYAADIEAYLLSSLAVDAFTETCPDVSWACPISKVRELLGDPDRR